MRNVVNTIIREEYGRTLKNTQPLWMIDAGSSIGDVSAYYLSRYEKLQVVALEPNPQNHSVAKINLRPYGDRCHLLQRALWSSEARLQLHGDLTMTRVSEIVDPHTSFDAKGITISKIIKLYNIPKIDILKIDIEGAEKEVFADNEIDWLLKTDLIIIEIHDRLSQDVVEKAMTTYGFEMSSYRSVVYCKRR
jgi:FkbM family methyltransferase